MEEGKDFQNGIQEQMNLTAYKMKGTIILRETNSTKFFKKYLS